MNAPINPKVGNRPTVYLSQGKAKLFTKHNKDGSFRYEVSSDNAPKDAFAPTSVSQMKMATGVHTRVSDYFDGKQDLQTGLARGESGGVLLQVTNPSEQGATSVSISLGQAKNVPDKLFAPNSLTDSSDGAFEISVTQGEAEGARGTTTLYKETMNGREVMGYLSGSTGTLTILE